MSPVRHGVQWTSRVSPTTRIVAPLVAIAAASGIGPGDRVHRLAVRRRCQQRLIVTTPTPGNPPVNAPTVRLTTTSSVPASGVPVAWVAPVGPTRHQAKVYLDGAYVTTLNLYRSSFLPRRIVFARNLADGAHSLVIKAQGTSGHPTVALDGLIS